MRRLVFALGFFAILLMAFGSSVYAATDYYTYTCCLNGNACSEPQNISPLFENMSLPLTVPSKQYGAITIDVDILSQGQLRFSISGASTVTPVTMAAGQSATLRVPMGAITCNATPGD